MEILIKKANRIKGLSWGTLITLVIAIVLYVVSAVIPVNAVMNDTTVSDGTAILVAIVVIIASIAIVVAAILSLILAIMILATDWQNPKLQNSKILWGLLSLFLLGFIGGLVFAGIVKDELGNSSSPSAPSAPSSFQQVGY